VDKPTPRDRIGIGKISPITTQAPGPQVEAKKKMYMQMNAIWTFTTVVLSGRIVPMMATINSQTSIPIAP